MTRARWTRGGAQQPVGATNARRVGSAPEELLALHLRARGLPGAVREARFHPVRKWRFDFAWPDRKVAAEVEGGQWTRGRHTRGSGFQRDAQKYNAAVALGWSIYRFTPAMVQSGEAVNTLERALTCLACQQKGGTCE